MVPRVASALERKGEAQHLDVGGAWRPRRSWGGRHRAVSRCPGPCRRLPLALGREAHLTVWSGRVLCGLGRATGPLRFGFLGCRMRVVPGLSSLDCREDG